MSSNNKEGCIMFTKKEMYLGFTVVAIFGVFFAIIAAAANQSAKADGLTIAIAIFSVIGLILGHRLGNVFGISCGIAFAILAGIISGAISQAFDKYTYSGFWVFIAAIAAISIGSIIGVCWQKFQEWKSYVPENGTITE